MLDKQKCPQKRQEKMMEHLIAEGRLIRPRGNAHGYNAINESAKRKRDGFRVHIVEEVGG